MSTFGWRRESTQRQKNLAGLTAGIALGRAILTQDAVGQGLKCQCECAMQKRMRSQASRRFTNTHPATSTSTAQPTNTASDSHESSTTTPASAAVPAGPVAAAGAAIG